MITWPHYVIVFFVYSIYRRHNIIARFILLKLVLKYCHLTQLFICTLLHGGTLFGHGSMLLKTQRKTGVWMENYESVVVKCEIELYKQKITKCVHLKQVWNIFIRWRKNTIRLKQFAVEYISFHFCFKNVNRSVQNENTCNYDLLEQELFSERLLCIYEGGLKNS